MFLRTVKARGGKGSQIEYVRLVENNRQNGKVKQRLVASLGRKDMLESVLDDLIRLLRGQPDADDLSLKTDRVSAVQAVVLDPETEQGYWLPVDAETDNVANWISNSTLSNMLKGIQSRHIMVVADSCFSGTLAHV